MGEHVSMIGADWITWALQGLLAFLVARVFKSQDKFKDEQDLLRNSVHELEKRVLEHYLTKEDVYGIKLDVIAELGRVRDALHDIRNHMLRQSAVAALAQEPWAHGQTDRRRAIRGKE